MGGWEISKPSLPSTFWTLSISLHFYKSVLYENYFLDNVFPQNRKGEGHCKFSCMKEFTYFSYGESLIVRPSWYFMNKKNLQVTSH